VSISEEDVEKAQKAYDAAISNPLMVECATCEGSGEVKVDQEIHPDWCPDCSGTGQVLSAGEELRPMREALEAVLLGMEEEGGKVERKP